ncbi:hypothetical protein AB833_21955 [Chromatiales bacterium (ex Bugula neritina AB1)]|nr:hypothetical protein AB833_21955 [Chromatiales bacterium (ex Bugula neritina AB1)]
MITAAGAGSGLNIESIISQLMTLEEQPINALRRDISELSSELSDVGRLKSAVSDLADVAEKLGDESKFGAWESTSNDEDVLVVSSAEGKTSENHQIEVSELAVAHRMVSNPYESVLTELPVGDYTFGSGEESFTVTLTSGLNTVSDLRSAINDSVDNTTVQASILNVDDGSRLVLSAVNTGTENVITAPPEFTELTAATDAVLEIDGLAVTSSSNMLTEAIPGLTIDIKAVGSADIVSNQNMDDIRDLLKEFTSSYNDMRSTMDNLAEGSLQGDSIIRRIDSAVRTDFFTPVDVGDSSEYSMFEFGFTFDKAGVLSIDETTMNESFAENLTRAVNVFTNEESGFASRMVSTLEEFTDIDGFFDIREEAIAARDKALDDQVLRLEDRLELTEARYRRQFGAMDALVSQLQSNGSYLLQSLSSANSGNN